MDLITLDQFPSVAANGTATLVTDKLLGRSIHALIFEQGGTTFTKAHMTNMNCRVAGKDLFDHITGAQLQDLNEYDGLSTTSDYSAFFFGDPTARTIRGQHVGDLDLSVYQDNLNITVDIGAATAPTLQCHALVGPPKLSMNIGFDPKDAATVRALIRTQVQPSGAVSRKSYGIGLGSEAGARLRKLAFFHTYITSIEMKKGGFIKHDDISILLNSYIQAEFGRVAQAGLYMLDRIVDSNQGEAEATLQSNGRPWPFQVNLTTSAADTIDVYADMHTAIPLL